MLPTDTTVQQILVPKSVARKPPNFAAYAGRPGPTTTNGPTVHRMSSAQGGAGRAVVYRRPSTGKLPEGNGVRDHNRGTSRATVPRDRGPRARDSGGYPARAVQRSVAQSPWGWDSAAFR